MEGEEVATAASTSTSTLKPINKAGHYGNLTPAQEKLLSDFEKALTEEGVLPDPILDDEEQRATVLL